MSKTMFLGPRPSLASVWAGDLKEVDGVVYFTCLNGDWKGKWYRDDQQVLIEGEKVRQEMVLIWEGELPPGVRTYEHAFQWLQEHRAQAMYDKADAAMADLTGNSDRLGPVVQDSTPVFEIRDQAGNTVSHEEYLKVLAGPSASGDAGDTPSGNAGVEFMIGYLNLAPYDANKARKAWASFQKERAGG